MSITSKRRIALVFSIGTVLLLIGFSWYSNSNNNVEKSNALEIFMDETLATPYIGQLLLGDAHLKTNKFPIWLKNNSPYTLSHLSLIPAPLPLNCTLTWNLQNHTLRPYEVKEAIITFIVPPSYNVENTIHLGGRFNIVYFIED